MAIPKESQPKALTKTQIIAHLAETNDLKKKQVSEFLDSFAELAYSETRKNKKFLIPGIGILKLNKRKARLGRNPATGEEIKIPARTAVKLTISKVCKDSILNNTK